MVNVSAKKFEILDRFRLLEQSDKRNEYFCLTDIIVYSHKEMILEFVINK